MADRIAGAWLATGMESILPAITVFQTKRT
jgi:hypothetical protein